ncbi:hypothetical protein J7E63_21355 [Bacillus sp. ISL-75]|uniref:hypothetical protein n=1 Tax=Bacillus sp. ISL-75 TaxID=2819137 RepID=UPI001BE65534|nr:hypothetical protein [Bacillus sp. ISL-75]MBT2729443.1 hypothetical protein [Bacillus sp. ISL-75]
MANIVQVVRGQTSNSTVTLTVPNATAGNTLVAIVAVNNGTTSYSTSISDSAGHSYTNHIETKNSTLAR